MTTILAVKHRDQVAMAGDGQVTMGESVIMKGSAQKIRKIYHDQVLVGFAGGVADALKLEEKFEGYLNEYKGNLMRAAVELAQEWRSDKIMKDLEALLVVADSDHLLMISGTGEVIQPDDEILGIGSGGNYALAAARVLKEHATDLTAEEMARSGLETAAGIDIYTNNHIKTLTLGGN